MIKRDFYTWNEALRFVRGDGETLRQAMLRGELRAYVELVDCDAIYFEGEGDAPKSGESHHASWTPLRERWSSSEGDRPFRLTGWYLLAGRDTKKVARARDALNEFGVTLSPATDEVSGRLPSSLDVLSFLADTRLDISRLWFRPADLSRFAPLETDASETQNGKPLDPRERGTLLRVIRALDAIAKMPERGAAPSIEKQLQALGFNSPKDATIRRILEEARSLEANGKPQ